MGFPQRYAAASLKPHAGWLRGCRAGGFPQRYAAASLKLGFFIHFNLDIARFPQRYAAASLKRVAFSLSLRCMFWFSAALRCGLIEAIHAPP